MSDQDPVEPGDGAGDEPLVVPVDESFVRGATVKEPSARARMLAQKWAKEPPTAQPHRSWAANHPAIQARRKRKFRRNVLVTLLVLVVGVAGYAAYQQKLHRGDADIAGDSHPVPNGVPRPVNTISAEAPFAGSPAERYADNAAGIALPKAAAVHGFTATEVAASLTRAKAYISATDLNRTVLVGRQVTPVRSLLDPNGARQHLDSLRNKYDLLGWLTRFDPDETALLGSVIKVHGTVTVRPVSVDELDVHLDFLFVYPVRDVRTGEVTRVIVRHILDLAAYHHRTVTPGFLWVNGTYTDAAGSKCEPRDTYWHPSYGGGGGTGPVEDPYDQNRPVPSAATNAPAGELPCGQVSRV